MNQSRYFFKSVSVALICAYSATNCVFVHAAETNFWAERKRAASIDSNRGAGQSGQAKRIVDAGPSRKGNSDKSNPVQLASLPAAFQFPDVSLLNLQTSADPSFRLRSTFPKGSESLLLPLVRALPQNIGTIRKIMSPPKRTGRVIIHVQDVHRNPEAQANISKAVQELINARQVNLIALEGAFGPMDFSWYRHYPYQDSVKALADYLIKEKRISGPVYTAFTSKTDIPLFVGVDEKRHYDANVRAYQESAPLVSSCKAKLHERIQEVASAKKRILTGRLKEFDGQVEAYRNGAVTWGDYVRLLSHYTDDLSPKIQAYLTVLDMEGKINFAQVGTERTQLIARLIGKLSKSESDELLRLSVAYRSGELTHADFYTNLKSLCAAKGINLTHYPSMEEYIQYVLLSENLDVDAILKESGSLEKKIYRSLAKTDQEQHLIETSRQLYLTGKLLDFSLTKEEWEEYKSSPWRWSANLASFESFYLEAEARDQAMASNLENAMETSKSKIGVLVTGGFHSNGIDQQLKSNGFTVISYVPKISKIEDQNGSAYLNVFSQEKTPLDKLFAGERLFLSPLIFPSEKFGRLATEAATAAAISPDGVGSVKDGRTQVQVVEEKRGKITQIKVSVVEAFGLLMTASYLLTGSIYSLFIDPASAIVSFAPVQTLFWIVVALSVLHGTFFAKTAPTDQRSRFFGLRIVSHSLIRLFFYLFYLPVALPTASYTLTALTVSIALGSSVVYWRAREVKTKRPNTLWSLMMKFVKAAVVVLGVVFAVTAGLYREFAVDRSIEWWTAPAPPLSTVAKLRPTWDPTRKIPVLTYDMDLNEEFLPTPEALPERLRFYRALKNGPIRPIDIRDLEAVQLARQELSPLMPYFEKSGRAHGVPADVLAAVALARRARQAYALTYSFRHGLQTVVDDGRTDVGPLQKKVLTLALHHMPEWVKHIRVQDRAAEVLGAIVGGASKRIGVMGIRAGPTDAMSHEYNVREDNLWGRDVSNWSNRGISWRLYNPEVNIETAATLYSRWHQEFEKDGTVLVFEPRELEELQRLSWLEDHQMRSILVNALMDPAGQFIPLAHVVVLEAGLFDTIPGIFVGLSKPEDIDTLIRLADGKDPYLCAAARRSLIDLEQNPAYRNAPFRPKVIQWIKASESNAGSSEKPQNPGAVATPFNRILSKIGGVTLVGGWEGFLTMCAYFAGPLLATASMVTWHRLFLNRDWSTAPPVFSDTTLLLALFIYTLAFVPATYFTFRKLHNRFGVIGLKSLKPSDIESATRTALAGLIGLLPAFAGLVLMIVGEDWMNGSIGSLLFSGFFTAAKSHASANATSQVKDGMQKASLFNRIQTGLEGEDLNLHVENVGDARAAVLTAVARRKNTVIIVDDQLSQLLTKERFLRGTLLEDLIRQAENNMSAGKILFIAQTEAIAERLVSVCPKGGRAEVFDGRDLFASVAENQGIGIRVKPFFELLRRNSIDPENPSDTAFLFPATIKPIGTAVEMSRWRWFVTDVLKLLIQDGKAYSVTVETEMKTIARVRQAA